MATLQLKKLLKNEPIAVTGIGTLTAAGNSLESLWNAVANGIAQGEWVEFEDFKYPACVVKNIELPSNLNFKFHRFDRSVKLALVAGRNALLDAGVLSEPGDKVFDKRNVGIIVGTSRGAIERISELFLTKPSKRILPSYSSNTSIAGLSGALAMAFGIEGMALTVSANCASSAAAISLAGKELALGIADSILAGGAEAPIHPAVLAAMSNAGILGKAQDPRLACRPFDISRNGTIIGEGSAFLHLERLRDAIKRRCHIYAILAGFAIRTNPVSNPLGMNDNGESLACVIQEALNIADISPSEISFINAHGTGTRLNDLAEARAIKKVFGSKTPLVTSIKAVTGHCLGASSAIESAISILALNKSQVPPTTNCFNKDAECDVNILIDKPQEIKKPLYALVISSGFWGHQSAIVFKKYIS